jgi:hypothetical protein
MMESYSEIEFNAPDNITRELSRLQYFPDRVKSFSDGFVQGSFYQPVIADLQFLFVTQAFSYYGSNSGQKASGEQYSQQIQVTPSMKSQQLFRRYNVYHRRSVVPAQP